MPSPPPIFFIFFLFFIFGGVANQAQSEIVTERMKKRNKGVSCHLVLVFKQCMGAHYQPWTDVAKAAEVPF